MVFAEGRQSGLTPKMVQLQTVILEEKQIKLGKHAELCLLKKDELGKQQLTMKQREYTNRKEEE